MTTTDPTPYTPTDEDMRDAWCEPPTPAQGQSLAYFDARSAEWDRWLAARDARVRAVSIEQEGKP